MANLDDVRLRRSIITSSKNRPIFLDEVREWESYKPRPNVQNILRFFRRGLKHYHICEPRPKIIAQFFRGEVREWRSFKRCPKKSLDIFWTRKYLNLVQKISGDFWEEFFEWQIIKTSVKKNRPTFWARLRMAKFQPCPNIREPRP